MKDIIQVRLGEIKLANAPGFLGCNGLGSCIGLVLFDQKQKVGGLAHVMLPSGKEKNPQKPGKYADLAVPWLLQALIKRGAKRAQVCAKMAGGAQMFAFSSNNELTRIGDRNIETVENVLAELSIPVVGKDVGGNFGRTIIFDLLTGELMVKTCNNGKKVL